MVVVQMVTYNHEKFVAQAIESVMMQKTSFRYKLIIAEDYSTDRTREICIELKNKYPEKIDLFLNSKNLGVTLNALQVHKACIAIGAKYVAICEGDDYWTDPLKLQKQVDFLENQPTCTICWGQTIVARSNSRAKEVQTIGRVEYLKLSNFLGGNSAGFRTCTTLFRSGNEYIDFVNLIENHQVAFGDWLLYLFLLRNPENSGAMLPELFGVYRQHALGSFSGLSHVQALNSFITFFEFVVHYKILQDKDSQEMLKFRDSIIRQKLALQNHQPAYRVFEFLNTLFRKISEKLM